jgi:hypothetical protein
VDRAGQPVRRRHESPAGPQVSLYFTVLSVHLFFATRSYAVHVGQTFVLYPVVYTQAAVGFFGGGARTAFKVLFALCLSFLCYSFLQTWVMRTIAVMTS